MTSFTDSVRELRRTRQAHHEARLAAWRALLASRPEVRAFLSEFELNEEQAGPLFWGGRFDHDQASGIELFEEGRGDEVLTQLRRAMHGIF